jgi:hypothetical protein
MDNPGIQSTSDIGHRTKRKNPPPKAKNIYMSNKGPQKTEVHQLLANDKQVLFLTRHRSCY